MNIMTNEEEILRRLNETHSAVMVAEEFDLNVFYVWKLAKAKKIPLESALTKKKGNKSRSRYYPLILSEWQKNPQASLYQIAKQTGVSHVTVYNVFKKAGIARSAKHATILTAKIARPQATQKQIADQCGVAQATVRKVLKKANLVTTSQKSHINQLQQRNVSAAAEEVAWMLTKTTTQLREMLGKTATHLQAEDEARRQKTKRSASHCKRTPLHRASPS